MGSKQIMIADDIGPDWMGMIGSKTITDQLILLQDDDDIEVLINSPGGFVDEGLAIFNVLVKEGEKRNVKTIVIGQACSIAALIFLAGKQREMMPGTKVMIHQASSGEWGFASDLRKKADELEAESENIFNLMMSRSDTIKSNEEKLRNYFNEEKFIFGDECVELGLAHKVQELPKAFKFSETKMMSIMSKLNMKSVTDLLNKFKKSVETKMSSVQTDGDNPTTIYFEGDTITEGTAVFSDPEMTTALADGDYIVGGSTYTVADGKVTAVATTQPAGDAGASASSEVSAEMLKSFPDGEYAVNGKTFVVSKGVVSEKTLAKVTEDPEFKKLQRENENTRKMLQSVQAQNKRLVDSMKELTDGLKAIGIGEGEEGGSGGKRNPENDMKDHKKRLLNLAETMESMRESGVGMK